MSVTPNPQVDPSAVEQARRQLQRLTEEIAQLSESDISPAEYYEGFLQRVVSAVAAPAGAVWLKTPQGNLQLQFQINMRQVGLDRSPDSRKMHDELLRQTTMKAKAGMFAPHSSMGQAEGGDIPPGNPTDHVIMVCPLVVDKNVAGLVELWLDPNNGPDFLHGLLNFLIRMAGLASGYTRNHQLRQMTGQQQVWTQLETFARQIHCSLNPTEVSYLVANEGRRLVEADRVSVAIRQGTSAKVFAISGADVVERRSNLVRSMRALFDAVLHWGEKLIYRGTRDDSLPPRVLKALDHYLGISNSKLLVVLPLRDDREKDSKWPARSAVLMESFEPSSSPEQLVARLEVVSRHAAPALYNASTYRRIPMRFLWVPLATLQDGLGGKARAILTLCAVALAALIAALILVPYPLRMEANGTLLPIKRVALFPPVEGTVKLIKENLKSGTPVYKDQELIRMEDLELGNKIRALNQEIAAAENTIVAYGRQGDRALDVLNAETTRRDKLAQRESLVRRTNAILSNPGEFWLRSPMTGIILTDTFRDNLVGRYVKPNEPLLRIGYANLKKPKISEWEIELKIPQKHVGQVQKAFPGSDLAEELDVDLLLTSDPSTSYRGKLARNKIASQAQINAEENSQPEPTVLAWVRVHGSDIPETSMLPANLLVTGIEVHARIRCGNHAMGYSLFYGVWEFLYEKIIFPYLMP